MEFIKEISIDLTGEMLSEYITAMQGDKGRKIKVTLLADEQPYEIQEETKIVLRAVKPDKTMVLNECTQDENGTIVVELTPQIMSICGKVQCQISLYGEEEEILTSGTFIINVIPKNAGDEAAESTNEFNILSDAVKEVEEARDKALEALSAISELEHVTENANTAADVATSAALNANSSAQKANAAYLAASGLSDICLSKAIVKGNPVIANLAANMPAANYRIYGNSTQNVTPLPEIPVKIESVGDLVTEGEHIGKYKVEAKMTNTNLNYETSVTAYLDEPLRKIGNVADYIDWKEQKVIRNVVCKKFNEVVWEKYTLSSKNYIGYHTDLDSVKPNRIVLCNYLPNIDSGYVNDSHGECISYASNQKRIIIKVLPERFPNKESVKNAIDYYFMYADNKSTKEDIVLIPMELEKGTNHIFTTTEIQPSNIEVEYYQDPTLVIEDLRKTNEVLTNAILSQGYNV